MTPKAIYSFDSTSSTGIENMPENSLMLIESDGNSLPQVIALTDVTGITTATTVQDVLDGSNYHKIGGGVATVSVLPLGSIIAIASNLVGSHAIPLTGVVDSNGFMYCDGSTIPVSNALSGTLPNLTDGRFIRGSTSSGVTGGNTAFTLAEANMPAHTHTGASHSHTGPSHSHTGASHRHTGAAHTHSIYHNHGSATTSSHAGHTHPRKNGFYQNSDYYDASTAYGNNGAYAASTSGRSAGSHSHTFDMPAFSGTSGGASATTTGYATPGTGGLGGTGATGLGGVLATTSVGSGTSVSHIPQYVNVQYIIKVN